MELTNEKIIEVLKEKFENVNVTIDTRFKEDLRADSIDLYQMVIEMEEEYSITIDDEEAMKIKTVLDLINAINK